MNKIEKIVYDVVKKNPRAKSAIRNIYQSFYDLFPDKENFSASKLTIREGYFFGFHDISPFSTDGSMILANKLEITETPMRMPEPQDGLTVGFWNSDLSKYTEFGKTFAWNYHKGCRLQWLNNKCNQAIFNNAKDGKLMASIVSIDKDMKQELAYPIDTVSHNGKYATSFSYERLNRYMPGYGYAYHDEPYFDEPESEKTGLFIVDIDKNERKLVVSLKTLAGIKKEDSMKGANHFVTHTEFSPEDKKVAFLHRWTYNDPEKRFTRLVTCNLDGSDIQISETTGMVSHYCWDTKHGILAYCQVGGIDGHYIFDDCNVKKPIRVANDLNSDGHQFFIPGSDKFVTDTYPDKRRYAKIYLSDINNKSSLLIVDVKSPKKFQSPTLEKHWACDLHPRVSPNGKYLCFDSVHTGKRALCIMELI